MCTFCKCWSGVVCPVDCRVCSYTRNGALLVGPKGTPYASIRAIPNSGNLFYRPRMLPFLCNIIRLLTYISAVSSY